MPASPCWEPNVGLHRHRRANLNVWLAGSQTIVRLASRVGERVSPNTQHIPVHPQRDASPGEKRDFQLSSGLQRTGIPVHDSPHGRVATTPVSTRRNDPSTASKPTASVLGLASASDGTRWSMQISFAFSVSLARDLELVATAFRLAGENRFGNLSDLLVSL